MVSVQCSHRTRLTKLFVNIGKLKVPIDSIHPADQEGVLAAYDRSMSGRAKGKILIEFAQAK